MALPLVFSVPLLLRSQLPCDPPEGLAFFRTGLETVSEGDARGCSAAAAEAAFVAGLPLSPSEARAALAEMLAFGREYADPGALWEQAVRERFFVFGEEGRRQAERAAVEAFSRTGECTRPSFVSSDDIRRALVESQKTLILAAALEGSRMEIAALSERARNGERKLGALLSEGEEEGAYASDASLAEAVLPEEFFAPWRRIVEAGLAFVPEDALLLTADSQMTWDLWNAGMLQPFPEDVAARCAAWPERMLSGLLLATLPAWRLAGRRFPPPDRPWLARDVALLVVRPGESRQACCEGDG